MKGLSSVLKKRRKELGLTLNQIAEQMGVAEATVQRWESGNIRSLRYEKIETLANILQVAPIALMGWPDDNESRNENAIELTLSEEEAEILQRIRTSSPEKVAAILELLK